MNSGFWLRNWKAVAIMDKLEFICNMDREELIGRCPVPAMVLDSVIAALGLKIEERRLPIELGALDFETRTIAVREGLSHEEWTYSLACQFGFYRLHRVRYELELMRGHVDQVEAESYARTFLLPRWLLVTEWGFQELRWCLRRGIRPPDQLVTVALDSLAKKFRVPRWVVRDRLLTMLGLWDARGNAAAKGDRPPWDR